MYIYMCVEQVVGGFWFGINHPLDIEGPEICGRWIAKKAELMRAGGFERDEKSYKWKYKGSTWLPKLFHKGGHFNQSTRSTSGTDAVKRSSAFVPSWTGCKSTTSSTAPG